MVKKSDFLPLSKEEFQARGWERIDIVLITGDAYVDHPAFGTAVVGRLLESRGYRVGIISAPDWKNPESVEIFGKPRLFFGVTSGNVDSMVSRYTAFKRYRSDDPYAAGGRAGQKPDRAVIVYSNLIKSAYKDVPIVLGGIEASMRRFNHYDFWSEKVRRSILVDSRADILVCGMGETQILEIANRLAGGQDLLDIPGTAILTLSPPPSAIHLPSEEQVRTSKEIFTEFYRLFYQNQHRLLAQPTGNRFIVHSPPSAGMSTGELDAIYELPYKRNPHPKYEEPVPAFDMIRHSVTAHRGCLSGCAFCSLSVHQGRRIRRRSTGSVLREIKKISQSADFRGHITDIGGPSANMYACNCVKNWRCARDSCTYPDLCRNLKPNTDEWIDLLQRAEAQAGIKKVSVGSGIRYDLLMSDTSETNLKRLLGSFVGGQLKIAPEHTENRVLRAMHKTPVFALDRFISIFRTEAKKMGKRIYLLPYLMSNHPGSEAGDMKAMRKTIRSLFGFVPKQVQAFIPLPMTISSAIYFTGEDPLTGEKFRVEDTPAGRRRQHNILLSGRLSERDPRRSKRPGGRRSK